MKKLNSFSLKASAAALVFALAVNIASAQSGALDPTFGIGGIATSTFLTYSQEKAHAVAVQSDGKILVGGSTFNNNNNTDFGIVRYHADGALDTTFGTNGKVITDIGGYSDNVIALAVQSDGKIVALGFSDSNYYSMVIARYNSDGTPDLNFGTGGRQVTETYFPYALAIQSDGKMVVTGFNGRNAMLSVERFNINGSPDNAFGVNGEVTYPLDGEGSGRALAIQGDGKIVVAGYQELLRYNSDGTPDNTFGVSGVVASYFGTLNEYPSSLAIQGDGKILVGGYDNGLFGLARFNSNGSPDISFANNGVTFALIGPGSNDGGFSIALQSDGKILQAGVSRIANVSLDYKVIRYNSNGSRDNAFGVNAIYTKAGMDTDIYAGPFLAMQADGKILLTGTLTTGPFAHGTNSDFMTLRINSDGSADNSFDHDGMVVTDFGIPVSTARASTVLIQNNGKIIACGTTDYDIGLARYNTDGSLDNTFNANATTLTGGYSNTAAALQGDGKIVVGGAAGTDFGLARYNSDGTLDNTFGTAGVYVSPEMGGGSAVALQSDGKIILGGYTLDIAASRNFALLRFNANGTPDNTFGSGGIVVSDSGSANAIAIQADGKIIVVGTKDDLTNAYFVLLRYDADGSPDNTFGIAGKVIIPMKIGVSPINPYPEATSVALQQDGKIVISGYVDNDAVPIPDFDFVVLRFNSDGSPDNSFGTAGMVTTDFGFQDVAESLAIMPDGKMVVAGYSFYPTSFALACYKSDGSPDSSFGTNGKVISLADIGGEAHSVALQSDGKIVAAGFHNTGTGYEYTLARYIAGDAASCHSGFSIAPDINQLHHYIVTVNSSGKQPLKYVWTWGDGSHDTIPYPTHTYADSGFYDICLSITDSAGCQSSFCDSSFHALRTTNTMVYITVYDPLTATTPLINVPTPQVIIYPNPFTSQTTIAFSEEQRNATIRITDLPGKEIKTTIFTGKQLILERGEMRDGIYFVQVTDDKGNKVNKKIIVQ